MHNLHRNKTKTFGWPVSLQQSKFKKMTFISEIIVE